MADELDKAVDLMRQLLADDGAKEKLSGIIENFIPQEENTAEESSDTSAENLLFSLLGNKKETDENQSFDFGSVLSSGVLQNMFSGKSDRRVTLLKALKPCLSEKRSGRIESAITVMQIINMSSAIGLDKLFK